MDPALLNLHIRRNITFSGFQVICKDTNGVVVPLAGWSAVGQIRTKGEDGELVYDLAPVIASNDSAGLITIPEIPWATTAGLPSGDYVYDLIPQTAAGKRLDPIVFGNVKISGTVSS